MTRVEKFNEFFKIVFVVLSYSFKISINKLLAYFVNIFCFNTIQIKYCFEQIVCSFVSMFWHVLNEYIETSKLIRLVIIYFFV